MLSLKTSLHSFIVAFFSHIGVVITEDVKRETGENDHVCPDKVLSRIIYS